MPCNVDSAAGASFEDADCRAMRRRMGALGDEGQERRSDGDQG